MYDSAIYYEQTVDIICRIDGNGVIKVADFGLTEEMYNTNYFRQERGEGGNEEKVPIRWMAPESIENDIYNEATDVVSHSLMIKHRLFSSQTVVIWCDNVGGVHVWKCPICWSTCDGTTEGATERREAGETRQCGLQR